MASPAVPVSGNQGEARPRIVSALYNLIMTPVVFISFIVSLALVDFWYSVRRSQFHADGMGQGQIPNWLHRLIYRYQRYQYVVVDERGEPISQEAATNRKFYHSKQRKLMRMEAADAFELRNSVLVVLAVISLGVAWAAWKVLGWGWFMVGGQLKLPGFAR
ncbi:hypothetical protein B0H63DRAFT_462090 [Podospora didyma]|uniref:Uncharacterized protein n=1 Tax=Podospora didyma TaxID=330526 RepID=A0AAE0P7L9_9PEZI|nr:hypothetical protein B0H63DRAFT_462090 [Podospora didyma]